MDHYNDTNNSAHEQPEEMPSQGPRQPNESNFEYYGELGCGDPSEGDEANGRGGEREGEEDRERGKAEGRAAMESDDDDDDTTLWGSCRSQSSYRAYSVANSLIAEPCDSAKSSSDNPPPEIPPSMSPGPSLGIPDIELAYHFLREPLRLSPQYRDCRGRNHLVARDEISFMDDD